MLPMCSTPKFLFVVLLLFNLCFYGCQTSQPEQKPLEILSSGTDLTEDTPVAYSQKENGENFNEQMTLESNGFIKFGLNKQTTFHSESVQLVEINGTTYYTMTNGHTNQILFYDYSKPETVAKVISIQEKDKQGQGILGNLHHHHIVNLDSIYIQSFSMLFLCDHTGKVLKSIPLVTRDLERPSGNPFPDSMSPITRVGDYLYIPCESNYIQRDYRNHKVILRYHMKTHQIDYIRNLPGLYSEAYWGRNYKYRISFVLQPKLGKLIMSFPIDPFVYVGDLEGYFEAKYFAGSKHFGSIQPMDADVEWPFKEKEGGNKVRDYSVSTSNYAGILYDPFNDLYYRHTFIRPSLENVNRGHLIDQSIIILDKDFKKVGEMFLPTHKYSYSMKFISKQGLHIARNDLYSQNENELTYEIFVPSRKD
jgi:hypothetical protein